MSSRAPYRVSCRVSFRDLLFVSFCVSLRDSLRVSFQVPYHVSVCCSFRVILFVSFCVLCVSSRVPYRVLFRVSFRGPYRVSFRVSSHVPYRVSMFRFAFIFVFRVAFRFGILYAHGPLARRILPLAALAGCCCGCCNMQLLLLLGLQILDCESGMHKLWQHS